MSLFGNQLLERNRKDQQDLSSAFFRVADASQGRTRFHPRRLAEEADLHELERICQYYKIPFPEEIPLTRDINDMIDDVSRASGMMFRRIRLQGNWWKNGNCAILAVHRKTGRFTALLPRLLGGFYYIDENEQKVNITKLTKDQFQPEAMCFLQPLPPEPLDGKQLVRLMLRSATWADYLLLLAACALVTVIGLLTPLITQIVFGQIIPSGQKLLVLSMAVLLISTSIASYLISVVRGELLDRIKAHMEVYVLHSVMIRILHLPAGFFSRKSTGGLSQSILAVKSLPAVITEAIIAPGITVLFSTVYVIQIARIASYLAVPAFVTLLVQLAIIFICIRQKMRISRHELFAQMKTQGMSYAILSGIQRIRLSGSEKRVFARWAQTYQHKASASFPAVFPCTYMAELVSAAALLGTLWVYSVGVSGGMDTARFAAFLSAYGLVTGALSTFSATGQSLASLKPTLDLADPILKAVPETGKNRIGIRSLTGRIDISHVSFRYEEKGRFILNDLDLHINAGEYIAIVGRSGCGKSTLMRILMGFETPEEGAVLYDDKNIEDIDPMSLRRNIGTVMQNDKLFAGDLFTNITISAPWLSMEDAWEAAEKAGLADAIRQMPLGMHTLVTEGTGGISGGQKQRLMIARAIAPRPNILIFDEATSGLDNITQRIVADSLDRMDCTRIVIAHRLSTIRNCDRIILIDEGKIIESGTYEELIEKDGAFADLVARQQI